MSQTFYQDRIKSLTIDKTAILNQLRNITYLRLFSFLCLLSFVSASLYYKEASFLYGSIPCLVAFGFLLNRNTALKKQLTLVQERIAINERELLALNLIFDSFGNGNIHQKPNHDYTHDMDIFGNKSLFQYLNRTTSILSEKKLADHLSQFEDNPKIIEKRQAAIQELMQKTVWSQDFIAKGITNKVSETDINGLKNWLDQGIDAFTNQKLWRFIFLAIPILMFIPLTAMIIGFLSFNQFLLFTIIPLLLTGKKLKLILHHHTKSISFLSLFKQQQAQTNAIENESFTSELLVQLKANLVLQNTKASSEIANLAKIVNGLDNRSNPIFAFVMNALLLWDLNYVFKLQQWINKNNSAILNWLDTVYQMETYISFATFATNNPTYVFPVLNETIPIQATALGHPLLAKNKRVDNSFAIDAMGKFTIITGANMAGKSTFLRAVGVNIILAMSGAPVCAQSFHFKPLKLYSSMRTADSLNENESYFYAELKRLKMLVDKLNNQEELFVILDEILKGTNSKDKAEGSKKFVDLLVTYPLAGIIATHDLSLCELAEKHPQKITNQYFDVEIINEELVFDYTLKNGICSNMNAAYLMDKMGITK